MFKSKSSVVTKFIAVLVLVTFASLSFVGEAAAYYPDHSDQLESDINWTPVIIVGAALAVLTIYLIARPKKAKNPENKTSSLDLGLHEASPEIAADKKAEAWFLPVALIGSNPEGKPQVGLGFAVGF